MVFATVDKGIFFKPSSLSLKKPAAFRVGTCDIAKPDLGLETNSGISKPPLKLSRETKNQFCSAKLKGRNKL